eukprot:NODE_31658_length_191_cov_0.718310_g30488_i0.p2 GENE.NODE_31658_length_191_cov_0.718310_g30488_i0~~NODE_31658_length_191_cov_0.718310_g30488_i0.p2  ORF type:complete len:56 (-),score=0.56 NODE_31658_length_191_cov_0.718310_g30488_i0:24-191(-)
MRKDSDSRLSVSCRDPSDEDPARSHEQQRSQQNSFKKQETKRIGKRMNEEQTTDE